MRTSPNVSLLLTLRRDVRNAGDGSLERAIVLCERIAVLFGGVIFIGVVLEIVLAIVNLPANEWLGYWGPVWANVLIAAGVGLAVSFGFRGASLQSELIRRSQTLLGRAVKVAAEANERAGIARLETERLKKLSAWRLVSEDVAKALGGALAEMPVASVRFVYAVGDHESRNFARQLAAIFWDHGWRTAVRASSFTTEVPFWVYIALKTELAADIKRAFDRAGIKQGTLEAPPPAAYNDFGSDLVEPIVEIFVGPKHMTESEDVDVGGNPITSDESPGDLICTSDATPDIQ